jgi:hypothetical protein
MKKSKLQVQVLAYCHSLKYSFVLDLRAFGSGRKSFKTRGEAEAEATRQKNVTRAPQSRTNRLVAA